SQPGPRFLARPVVRKLLRRFPALVDRVGLVIGVSFAPADFSSWSLAAWVQHACGIPNAQAIDVYQGCVGFLQGLQIAARSIASREHEAVLVFSSEWFE